MSDAVMIVSTSGEWEVRSHDGELLATLAERMEAVDWAVEHVDAVIVVKPTR